MATTKIRALDNLRVPHPVCPDVGRERLLRRVGIFLSVRPSGQPACRGQGICFFFEFLSGHGFSLSAFASRGGGVHPARRLVLSVLPKGAQRRAFVLFSRAVRRKMSAASACVQVEKLDLLSFRLS